MTEGSPAESVGFSDLLDRGWEEAVREEGSVIANPRQWLTKEGLQPGLPKGPQTSSMHSQELVKMQKQPPATPQTHAVGVCVLLTRVLT